MASFKLYTTTQFRVYKNRGGRFVPLYKNGSTWESFTELGTIVTRAGRGNAEKFIQKKADRLFYGQATIEYIETEPVPGKNTLTEEELQQISLYKNRLQALNEHLNDPYLTKGGLGEQMILQQKEKCIQWLLEHGISLQ